MCIVQHPYIGDLTNSENDLPNVVLLGHRVLLRRKVCVDEAMNSSPPSGESSSGYQGMREPYYGCSSFSYHVYTEVSSSNHGRCA